MQISSNSVLWFDITEFFLYNHDEKEVLMLPQDPVMLLSYVNLKLRDQYQSLEEMCDDLDIPASRVTEPLEAIDYHYSAERNQFV